MLKMNRPCLSIKYPDSASKLNSTEPPYGASQLVSHTCALLLSASMSILTGKRRCETLLSCSSLLFPLLPWEMTHGEHQIISYLINTLHRALFLHPLTDAQWCSPFSLVPVAPAFMTLPLWRPFFDQAKYLMILGSNLRFLVSPLQT